MSSTGGNQTPPTYDGFTTKMHDIIGANFYREVPLQTKRSKGLDSQGGLVVGGIPNSMALHDLFDGLKRLPAAWSVYDWFNVHCTFGSYEDLSARAITPGLHDNFEKLVDGVKGVANAYRFDPQAQPTLIGLELRVSADTLILAATLNHPAFQLRQRVLSALDCDYPKVREGSWGSHMTLARATRPLTDEERGITDAWIAETRTPHIVWLDQLFVGAFIVRDEKFAFDPEHHVIFPITHHSR